MRFEKTLDPNQNTIGILRFLKLLDSQGIKSETSSYISSVGIITKPITIKLIMVDILIRKFITA